MLKSRTNPTVTNNQHLAPAFEPPVRQNLPELSDEFVPDDMFEYSNNSESELLFPL